MSIHGVPNGRISFFHGWVVFHYIYIYIIFIHSSIDGPLGCFHIFVMVNNAAVNIGVHVSFQISIFLFFEYIPRSGIAGSYGNSIFVFFKGTSVLFSTALHSGCTNLHSHQQCRRVPFSPHPHQHLLFVVFLILDFVVHSDRCKVISHCGLICISLMISSVEHLFMCLLAICMSSLEKCLFRSPACFWIGVFVSLILSWMSCLYILEINPLSVDSFANIFSHSEGLSFRLVYGFLCCAKALKFH